MDARFPDGTERRGSSGCVEYRAAGRRLEGYAAVFGVVARIGRFAETVLPGAFRATLASGRDVLALADHDPARLLARTSSGSLRLAEDTRGLHFELDLPDTSLGRDMLAMAERRDLGGMSFGFKVSPDGGESWPTSSVRELRSVELIEISVVQAFPAYSQTSVSARSRTAGRAEAGARIRRMILESL